MKIPSELELLGMQTAFDAEQMRKEYPEWFALSDEERGLPELRARYRRHAIFCYTALIVYLLATAGWVIWWMIIYVWS